MPRELSPKQQRFVDEFMIDGNYSAAGLRAGYKDPSAGRKLGTKRHVKEAIRARQQEISAELGIKAGTILTETARIGLSDIRKCFGPDGKPKPIQEIDTDTAAAIQSYRVRDTEHGRDVEFRLWNKLDALEKLGAQFDLFRRAQVPIDTVEALLALLPHQLATDVRVHIAFPDGPPRVEQPPGTGAGRVGTGRDEGAERLAG